MDGIYIDDVEINVDGIGINENSGTTASKLCGIYPNPSKDLTHISFIIGNDEDVLIEVFDMLGQKVRVITDKFLAKGSHTVIWDGMNASGSGTHEGIYFVRMKAGDSFSEKKVVIIK
ncbi:MAG: T9SS type A sorting domain-containing protein [Bacteroidetes bacterium]|nr:T9SS type A sorting domain-containing protein [Bacteroidota bacterium]